jgi:formylglycine-generating enzyme required for sulfatase activity
MKKFEIIRNRTMGISAAIVISMIAATGLTTAPVWAADQNGAAQDGPFTDGTGNVRLSPSEKASLLQYADNSNAKLQKALDQAQGKGFADANGIYLTAIRQVVIESFSQKPRSELLMRTALNQALELTFGIPTADGTGIAKAGVLKDISNQALLTVILEDSIKLAQSYYQDDRAAIQKGSLLDLPYMRLAAQRLTLSRQWMASVLEPGAQYQLEVATLQQFLNTAANDEQQHRAYFAEELTHADDLLGQYSPDTPKDVKTLMEDIRVLRGEIRKLESSVTTKLKAEGQEANAGPGNSGGGASSSGSNALGMSFVGIQPGTFMMGSPSSEANRSDDETQHQVTISHRFEMQTTDVTQAQWVQVMGTNPSYFQSAQYCQSTFTQVNGVNVCPNNPVEQVSWDDVQQYVTKLNQNRNDGYAYRLPTEAEWEYAARAGTTTAYYFGNDASQINNNSWYSSNSGGQTHEVGKLHANAWGLYDMAGNVWQWVQDYYGDYDRSHVTDPVGPAGGPNRVVRGGGWYDVARYLRSAARYANPADFRCDALGFRLVRTQ